MEAEQLLFDQDDEGDEESYSNNDDKISWDIDDDDKLMELSNSILIGGS